MKEFILSRCSVCFLELATLGFQSIAAVYTLTHTDLRSASGNRIAAHT